MSNETHRAAARQQLAASRALIVTVRSSDPASRIDPDVLERLFLTFEQTTETLARELYGKPATSEEHRHA